MMYLHESNCISPQQTFEPVDFDLVQTNENVWLKAIEPKLEGIPRGVLRRMGKAVRLGVGAALPILESNPEIGGIILGTANGGMEDCIKFLNQVIEFDEGTLTPTNFVQSTTNAIAGQLGLLSKNKGYNATHVHRGLAFENALIDAFFFLQQQRDSSVVVGGIDEISDYNYNIDRLAGWYKTEELSNVNLYKSKTAGSIPGEGAAMFVVNNASAHAAAEIKKIKTVHTKNAFDLDYILGEIKAEYNPAVLMSGENGDVRFKHFFEHVETAFPTSTVLRYKHLCGEYPTTSSFALWIAQRTLKSGEIPGFIDVKRAGKKEGPWLIYNCYHGSQHGFIVVDAV